MWKKPSQKKTFIYFALFRGCFQLRSAVWAADCFDADLRLAVRAGLGRRSRFFSAHRVESFDNQEKNESLNKEINQTGNELTVRENRAKNGKVQVVKLRAAGKKA